MIGEIVVIRVQVPVHKTQLFLDSCNKANTFLEELPGFIGMSVWGDTADGESFIIVYETTDEESAEKGFKALASADLLQELSEPTEGTILNRWIRVVESKGKTIASMPPDSYLSSSRRISEPGRTHELEEDYQMVFASLGLMPGFAGSAYGSASNVPEQMIGLVWWNSKEAFEASVPNKDSSELHLFRRIHASEMEATPSEFSTTLV